MAQQTLDATMNEDLGGMLAKLNTMLAELYAADVAWSGTSVTATGAISGGTVESSGAMTAGGLLTGDTSKLGTGTKTATATAGAATLNKAAGVITTEALTTAAGSGYSLTITNSAIAAADQVFASVQNGTNAAGMPIVRSVTPAAGSVVIIIENIHSAAALNGTLKIAFASFKN